MSAELWLACIYADQCDPDSPADTYIRRKRNSFLQDSHDKVAAAILDALAESCIHDARHQRVAVSLTSTPRGVTLCVSQIGGSAEIVANHLHGVLEHLRRIRDSRASPSDPEHTKQLMQEFELFLVKFSFEKLRWCILKHIHDFVEYVVPNMDAFTNMGSHLARLRALIDSFRAIRDKVPLQGSMPDADLYWLIDRISSLHEEWYPLRSTLRLVDANASASFSLAQYLRKISSFHRNYLFLMRLATSDRLSGMLASHWVVQIIPSTQRHIALYTHFDNFVPLMKSEYVKADNMKQVHSRLVDQLVRITEMTGINRTVSEDKNAIDFGMVNVHPECVLLAYHKRVANDTPAPFPYVGTSRPPCRGCQYYIEAFSYHGFLPPPRFSYREPFDVLKPAVVCFPWAAPLIYPVDPSGNISPVDVDVMRGLINNLGRDIAYCLRQAILQR